MSLREYSVTSPEQASSLVATLQEEENIGKRGVLIVCGVKTPGSLHD